jgi:LacI family transcriptional regulator, repressor for deo operon, udp, cdd, tsx, nupC, and nupG
MLYKPVTIKEIAKKLNVSVSTVSRALSNNPRIGLGTRLKVQELAKAMEYEPNSKAIFFKQSKSFVIGVVVPNIREDFFSEAISGIEKVTMEQDYTILFGQSYDDMEKEKKVIAAMKKQRVDGLIISLSKTTNSFDHLASLTKVNIPIVYFDRVPPFEKAHKVYCNLYKSTLEMIEWLFKKGHRRIGFINGPSGLPASKERMKGYIDGISKQKIKIDMQLVEETDFSKEKTCEAMQKLLALPAPPKAIITFNDYVHMEAVKYAESQNIKINKDIVFTSYANLPITSYTAHPPVLSIEQYPKTQGEKAIEIMMKILETGNTSNGNDPFFYTHEIPTLLEEYK